MNGNNCVELNLKSLDRLGNILFDEDKGYCSVKLNREFYSLEAIQFAAHHLSDEIRTIIDSDSKDRISIEIFVKDATRDIKEIFWKFNESLIAYTVYLIQSDRNKEIREAILKKALSVG